MHPARRLAWRSAATSLAVVALLAVVGCSTKWAAPETVFQGYPKRERPVDLRVELVLPPELRDAKWERDGGLEVLLGPSLVKNAEALARHVFREVVVVEAPGVGRASDVVLTPRLAYAGVALAACGPCDSVVAVKVEWRLARGNGQPLWIHTVNGQVKGKFPRNEGEIFGRAIDDMLLQSERAMRESAAIRTAAAGK